MVTALGEWKIRKVGGDQPFPGERNIGAVRSKLPTNRTKKSNLTGLAVFLFDGAVYIISFWTIIICPYWPIKAVLIPVNGLFIGCLFVIGHDACHGSCFTRSGLNRIIGRIAFLPALNIFTTWQIAHNQLHHGHTNKKGSEEVFTPLSIAEYKGLSPMGKRVQRFYRTPIGIILYYQIEVWLKRIVFPRKCDLERLNMSAYLGDLILVGGYVLLEICAVVFLAPLVAASLGLQTETALVNTILAIGLPFMFWIWLYVFITFLHHTHPKVPWFERGAEWDFFSSQVESSVHIKVPSFFRLLTNNILEHTAHHADVRIPFYNLHSSQLALVRQYPDSIQEHVGIVFSAIETLKICKLYDFKEDKWMDFEGRVTSVAGFPKAQAMAN